MMNIPLLPWIPVIAGTVAWTVVRSKIFFRLRKAVSPIKFLHDLLSCPYCFSHWVLFALMPFANNKAFEVGPLPTATGIVLGTFAMVPLALVVTILIEWLHYLLEVAKKRVVNL
jgi:hypothetical protein